MAVAGGVAFWLWPRGAIHPPAPPSAPVGTGAEAGSPDTGQTEADLLKSWAAGTFTRLAGSDIRRDLDRFLMLDAKAELPAGAEAALRAKLAAFLKAYSSTDFEEYVRYRDPSTLCAKGHLQLDWLLDAQRALAAQAGVDPPELPEEPIEFLRLTWQNACNAGGGPGPFIEAVNWRSARVTVRSLSKREIVLAEWEERAGAECHLYKEFVASGRRAESPVVTEKYVPNGMSAPEIVSRTGKLVFADFEIVMRRAPDPANPMVARFFWDEQRAAWLPSAVLKLWSRGPKPLYW